MASIIALREKAEEYFEKARQAMKDEDVTAYHAYKMVGQKLMEQADSILFNRHKSIKEIVADLTEEDRLLLLSEWDKFVKDGAIGECFLRATARKMYEHAAIVSAMRDLIFEVAMFYTPKRGA